MNLDDNIATSLGIEIRLDWKSYYESFLDVHGEPINHKGRQLFSDGWTYALEDYQGPEWPPPTDPEELKELQLMYWTHYHDKIQGEYTRLKNIIMSLQKWADARSLPLQQRIVYADRDKTGRPITKLGEPENLDLHSLESKLEDLEHILTEADEKLVNLRSEHD